MKVYIVEGATGEYSDHREWVVCGYSMEHHAQEHVKAAQEYAGSLRAMINWDDLDYDEQEKLEKSNPYDPDMEVSYNGVNYTYYPVEIKDYFEIKEAK